MCVCVLYLLIVYKKASLMMADKLNREITFYLCEVRLRGNVCDSYFFNDTCTSRTTYDYAATSLKVVQHAPQRWIFPSARPLLRKYTYSYVQRDVRTTTKNRGDRVFSWTRSTPFQSPTQVHYYVCTIPSFT